jgi:glycosyltransferase involved in cell wall biosynthesis
VESTINKDVASANANSPLVSVIVPTYNRPDTFAEALQSIVAQTYATIEILVVNDAGADVGPIISSVKSRHRIIYLKHSINQGMAAARNTGLKAASGEYIAYLDDDDVYYPDHIATLVSFLLASGHKVAYTDAYQAEECIHRSFLRDFRVIRARSFRQITFVFALSRVVPHWCFNFLYDACKALIPYLDHHHFMKLNSSGIDMFSRGRGKYLVTKRTVRYSDEFDRDMILVRNFIPILCLMHHRSCLDRTGLFDEGLRTHEDWDLWIRMSREHDFAHIKKVTCEFSWRTDGSSVTSGMKDDFARTTEVIYSKYQDLARTNQEILEAQKVCLRNLKNELAAAKGYLA